MRKKISLVCWICALVLVVFAFGQPVSADEVYNTAFLTDAQLENSSSMSETQIRQFLINNKSYYSKPVQDSDGVTFDAAQVIAQASAQFQINPQVLLVTMQKESSAITSGKSGYLPALMGCAGPAQPLPVPNGTARWQLWCAAERFRSYQNQQTKSGATVSGWKVGAAKKTCDAVTVTPATKAVAGQFTYTPQAGNKWGGNGYECNNTFHSEGIGGVYLFYLYWNQFGFGGNVVPPAPPIQSIATSTVLALDVSGSMAADDPSGKTKIQALQAAASALLEMINTENKVQGAKHRVSLITFSTQANTNLDLSSDLAQAQSIVSGLSADGGTNIADALTRANGALNGIAQNEPRFVLLLTDGVPTVSLGGQDAQSLDEIEALKQEILQGPVRDAAQNKNCIYTIGFGNPGEVYQGAPSYDPEFLKQIADTSSCGKAYEAKDATELVNLYIQFRHKALGDVIGEFRGQIAQGQTLLAGNVTVAPNQDTLYATLNWPGSRLELDLIDPQGQHVTTAYSGASITIDPRLYYLIIKNPMPGPWRVNVVGVDVPENVTTYNTILSTRVSAVTPVPTSSNVMGVNVPLPNPRPDWFPILAIFFIAVGGGALVLFVVMAQRGGAQGELIVVSGRASRGRIPLGKGALRIGRGGMCQVRLSSDPQVSKNHAEIRRSSEGFVIQDLSSKNGTFVNGKRVSYAVLKNGDEIRVGESVLRVQDLK